MLTKGAIGNLVNRYKAVLKKCNLINTFGSLAMASMLVLGGAGAAEATYYAAEGKAYTSSTDTETLIGGWYGIDKVPADTNLESLGSEAETQLIVTDGSYKNISGGHYAGTSPAYTGPSDDEKIELAGKGADITVTSTHVTINDATVTGSVAGGNYITRYSAVDWSFGNEKIESNIENGAYVSGIINSNTSETNLIINGGTFGTSDTMGGSYTDPNSFVIGGDFIKDDGSIRAKYNSEVGTANTTINGGTFNCAVIGGSVIDQYRRYRSELSASVDLANLTINGGTFNQPIYAAGAAYTGFSSDDVKDDVVANDAESYTSHVEKAVLNINGGTFNDNSDIYAGGLIQYKKDGKNYLSTVTVGKSEVTIRNASVNNVYGVTGYSTYESNDVWAYSDKFDGVQNAVDTTLTIINSSVKTIDIPSGTVTLRAENAGTTSVERLNAPAVAVSADGTTNDAVNGDVSLLMEKHIQVEENSGFESASRSMEEGLVSGATTASIDNDGNISNVKTSKNTFMEAVLEQASVTMVSLDKILTKDVRKRLGDIRSDANTTGVWMRWDGGKLKGEGLTNNFNTIQIGGDTKVAKNCRLGVAGSFTHGDTDFARGNGELEGFSFAAYATWMGENGMFADVVARLGHFSTEMNVEGRTGDMDNRVASLSGEYGWRFNVCDQFFIEPQVELAYTYVNSEDLELGDAKYHFDNVDSLTGRAGLVAGWNLPDDRGNVYARASVVQQFMGDAKISGTKGIAHNVQEIDGEDTWLEYGLGANIKLTDKTYIWADVERTEGAEIEEEWRGTVGFRYSF